MKLRIVIFILSLCLPIALSTVNNFGGKFPELVSSNPNQKWIIKFYAPWCHHCQQLEPTYVKVAEILHRNHENIVVGRVDCTKYQTICQNYGVEYFPSIVYIDHKTHVHYSGDRSAKGIIEFAERLSGPDVNSVENCNQLKGLPDKHNIIVLSTEKNTSSKTHTTFESLASKLKSDYWFYHFTDTCEDFYQDQGLYLLKRHLNYPIKFESNVTSDGGNLENKIKQWIIVESIPVCGRLVSGNIETMLASGKTLVVSILDEYIPARILAQSSKTFLEKFREFAKKVSQRNHRQERQDILFSWTTELELIQTIVLRHVQVPNVIVLKQDLTYKLLIEEQPDGKDDEKTTLLKLGEESLDKLIYAIESGKLKFEGGNSASRYVMRKVYSITTTIMSLYRSNPLLAMLLIGMPSLILMFVIYTTCFYDASYSDDNEEKRLLSSDDDSEDEDECYDEGGLKIRNRRQKHSKQD